MKFIKSVFVFTVILSLTEIAVAQDLIVNHSVPLRYPLKTIVSDDLELWYLMDEGDGLSIHDFALPANDATFDNATGPIWAIGSNGAGYSLDFDANATGGDADTLGFTAITRTRDFTICMWYRGNGRNSAWRDLFGSNGVDYGPQINSGNKLVWLGGGTVAGSTNISQDIWYHFAISVSPGDVAKVYVNAALDASGSVSPTSQNWNRIGDTGLFGEHTAGFVDDVRFYLRELNAHEVKLIYEETFRKNDKELNLLSIAALFTPGPVTLPSSTTRRRFIITNDE